jgi:hypothetical protein
MSGLRGGGGLVDCRHGYAAGGRGVYKCAGPKPVRLLQFVSTPPGTGRVVLLAAQLHRAEKETHGEKGAVQQFAIL